MSAEKSVSADRLSDKEIKARYTKEELEELIAVGSKPSDDLKVVFNMWLRRPEDPEASQRVFFSGRFGNEVCRKAIHRALEEFDVVREGEALASYQSKNGKKGFALVSKHKL